MLAKVAFSSAIGADVVNNVFFRSGTKLQDSTALAQNLAACFK